MREQKKYKKKKPLRHSLKIVDFIYADILLYIHKYLVCVLQFVCFVGLVFLETVVIIQPHIENIQPRFQEKR